MGLSANFHLIAVTTMLLFHMCFGTFVLSQYYHPWVSSSLRNNPPLFWPEPNQIFVPESSKWGWPSPPRRWPNHFHPLWPVAGPADNEPGPNRVPSIPESTPNIFDQTSPQPTADQVTPERFGFVIPTTNVKPILIGRPTPTEGQFSGSSPRPTRTDFFQTESSVFVSESSSTTTTEAWTFPPTTQDPVQAKIQLSMCITNCVTDNSIKSVCGSDNKTYQNRQYLDCAQKCGRDIRLDYTGRCIPNPRTG